MKYVVAKEKGFEIVGPKINVSVKNNENFNKIPRFWDDVMHDESFSKLEEHVGEKGIMGVCANFNPDNNTFDYFIAIEKPDEEVDYPELSISDSTWVKFKGFGKLPYDLQNMVKNIPNWFKEHTEYVRNDQPEVEIYHPFKDEYGNQGFELWIGVEAV